MKCPTDTYASISVVFVLAIFLLLLFFCFVLFCFGLCMLLHMLSNYTDAIDRRYFDTLRVYTIPLLCQQLTVNLTHAYIFVVFLWILIA